MRLVLIPNSSQIKLLYGGQQQSLLTSSVVLLLPLAPSALVTDSEYVQSIVSAV
jgi:hypothetical protein